MIINLIDIVEKQDKHSGVLAVVAKITCSMYSTIFVKFVMLLIKIQHLIK